MPQYSINVLFLDQNQSCADVKDLMRVKKNNYIIKDADGLVDFDHMGIKFFPTLGDALDASEQLRKDAKGKILQISVSSV